MELDRHRRITGSDRKLPQPYFVLVGLILVVAACGDSTPRRTITGSEAIERIDGYLKSAIAAAPSSLRLRRITAEATYGGGCSKSRFSDDFTGQVEADVTYETSEVSSDTAESYLASVVQLWEQEFGKVDRGAVQNFMNVNIGKGGWALYGQYFAPPGIRRVQIGGRSPCIWANGTPGPSDNP